MAGGGSKQSVLAAIAGNSVICVAKFTGFFVTGSGAMLSEGIHTAADLMNQWLLFLGIVKSDKAPDAAFPFGYAKERFVWALISAVGIFFLGCGVTIVHGIHSVMHPPEELPDLSWAIGILVFSLILEGIVLWIAAKDLWVKSKARQMPFGTYCREYADPSAVAVLLEDSAACFGVILALTSLGLTVWTGNTYWDGIGSISIGILLGAVAIWLIQRNRSLLVGASIPGGDAERLHETISAHPSIDSITSVRAGLDDADNYRVQIEADFDGKALARHLTPFLDAQYEGIRKGDREAFTAFAEEYADKVVQTLGAEIDDLEEEVRKVIPQATHIDVEQVSESDEEAIP